MKIDWTSRTRLVPYTLPVAVPVAQVEAQANAHAGRLRHCAKLSLRSYGDEIKNQRKPDIAKGVFVDDALNLRAKAEIIDGEAYLAFRGTVGVANWFRVNFRASKTGEPARHRGFWTAWQTLKPQIKAWLEQHRPSALNITGHSMGAAMAQFAALELCAAWPVQQVILFATPMLGTAGFNQTYSAATVASSGCSLNTCTARYLLLSDAISIPLPRLLGYESPLPVLCIDQTGGPAGKVPGLLEQSFGQLTGNPEPPRPAPLIRYALISREVDMGKPTLIEEQMGAFRTLALSQGTWAGWLGLFALASFNVLRRAVGFHSMKLYAQAFHALPHIGETV